MPARTEDLDKAIAEVTGTFDGVEEISAGLREGVINCIAKTYWRSCYGIAGEQALLFGQARRTARQRAARGRGKESLQQSLINFHLYFAQMKGNTIGWKMTFRKSKLIDNRPSWPALNYRGKCRNTMLLSPKPVLSGDRWTHSEKGERQRKKIAFFFCEG